MVQVFISYRRSSSVDRAFLIAQFLRSKRISFFLDYESLSSGPFPEQIIENIRQSTHFLLLLCNDDLERCMHSEEDWIRREVEEGIKNNCTIIPVVCRGFVLPTELPPGMQALSTYQQIRWAEPEYTPTALEKILEFITSSSNSQPENSCDFIVTQRHLHPICQILEEHASSGLRSSWKIILSLLFDARDRIDINQNDSFYALTYNSLEHWVITQGRNAKFQILIKCLEQRRLVSVTEKLMEEVNTLYQL